MIAAIGDIHGCIDELRLLVSRLEWLPLDEIWSLGDVCDRGPDSHACYDLLRQKKIKIVAGNHDDVIASNWDTWKRTGQITKNLDKARTLQQLTEQDISDIKSSPHLHVSDKFGLVMVHGGVWPRLSLWQQPPKGVIRAQMIHPALTGENRWWGPDSTMQNGGKTEAENVKDGFRRWYELYDGKEAVVYGHSVWNQPFIHQNKDAGMTIGVDTGVCFGGALTALIWDGVNPSFVSVKSRVVHFPLTRRIIQD